MNVGYMNAGMNFDSNCPLCGDDVYVNKYGTDYKCMNEECVLNRKASVVIDEINSVLDIGWKGIVADYD
jgi:NAD-dependent DNA ligase